jgi:beta-1,4-mannosyltransferase
MRPQDPTPTNGARRPTRVMGRPAFKTRVWNPYNWLLYEHLRGIGVEVEESTRRGVIRGRHDVLHLHWPEQHLNSPSRVFAFGRSLTLLAQLAWVRARGIKVVWTVHNLAAHERRYPRAERLFWRSFIALLDGYICLTESSRVLAMERFPRLRSLPGFVVPHGHYRSVYPNGVSRVEARVRLGLPLEEPVLLSIGSIREYKNIPHLIRQFRAGASGDALLMVAGKPSDEPLEREIRREAGEDARVRLHLSFIADDDLQTYFNACDGVVLPYREILNSGSAILALSFNRPVLLPRSTCGDELREMVGEGWVRLYEGELDTSTLSDFARWSAARRGQAAPDLAPLAWPRIASLTADAYASIVEGRR